MEPALTLPAWLESAWATTNASGVVKWTMNATGVELRVQSNSTTQGTLEAVTYNIPVFNQMSMIKTVVLSIMFFVSLVGNTTTLLQMYRKRRRRSTINTLILHLATADLIVTFFCIVSDAVWASTVQWYAGNAMCKLVKFTQVFGLTLSTYIIVIVSIDRCLAILDPMSRNKAPQRVRTMIVVAWILSFIFSVPQAYIFRVVRAPFDEEFYQCVTIGAYSAEWQAKLYSGLSFLLTFVIPLFTMVTAYMLIFFTINTKSRDFQREPSEDSEMCSRGSVRGELFRKAKAKSLMMTAVIVIAFIVCWTPYWSLYILTTFMSTEKIDKRAVLWIFFFGMANSMVNPMIYGTFQFCRRGKQRNPIPIKFGNVNQLARSSSSRDSPRGQVAAPLDEEHKTAGLRTTCVHRNGTCEWGFRVQLLRPKTCSSSSSSEKKY